MNIKNILKLLRLFSFILILLSYENSFAYDLPVVNLGLTSFLDGGPPGGGTGIYGLQYLQQFSANKFTNTDGGELPLAGPDLDVTLLLTQFIWISEKSWLGGKLGGTVLLPYVFPDMDLEAGGSFPTDGNKGFGDITLSPLIQWGPYVRNGRPVFMHRLNLPFRLPTGKYSSQSEINPGSNSWNFNPYWAATWFITKKLEFSTRLHYLWSAKNNDSNRSFGPNAASTQAGQAFHINFAGSYEVISKKLRLGFSGYYLKQFSDTQINGESVTGRKEEVFGIGPGLVMFINKNNAVFLNSYFETAAKNRAEGLRFGLRWAHRF